MELGVRGGRGGGGGLRNQSGCSSIWETNFDLLARTWLSNTPPLPWTLLCGDNWGRVVVGVLPTPSPSQKACSSLGRTSPRRQAQGVLAK